MKWHGEAATDIGRRRAHNEDAFLVDDDMGLYVVADGMGGHAAGDVASQEAIDAVYNMVARDRAKLRRLAEAPSPDAIAQAKRVLESAIQAATYMVFGLAQHSPGAKGMGTTLSALLLAGEHGIIGQVGDSRIYLVREGGVTRVTEDHTLVAWQVKQGVLTEEEAARSPQRNVITRSVGSKDYVQVDVNVLELHTNDRFVLCSDGLHGYVRDEEIGPIVMLEPSTAARRFVSLANERGGRDNITAIVVGVR